MTPDWAVLLIPALTITLLLWLWREGGDE